MPRLSPTPLLTDSQTSGDLHEIERQRQRSNWQYPHQQQRSGQRGLSSVAIQGPIQPTPGPRGSSARPTGLFVESVGDDSCQSLLDGGGCTEGDALSRFVESQPGTMPHTPGDSSASSASGRETPACSGEDCDRAAAGGWGAGVAGPYGLSSSGGVHGVGAGSASGSGGSGGSAGHAARNPSSHHQSERGWTAGGQCFPNWAVLHMLQKSLRPSKGAMAR